MDNLVSETQTLSEKAAAVNNLKKSLEDNFLSLAELLSQLKRSNYHKNKGYKNFKEFVEKEFNLTGSFAQKLTGCFQLFVEELAVDEMSVKEIGLDKLQVLKPLLKDSNIQETEDWLEKAQNLPVSELRSEVKDVRSKSKEKTLKEVFCDQFIEKMVTFFNCSRKELDFKLALYFQDADLETIYKEIRQKQRLFEEKDNF
jgi:ketol-acid reductoisomerase